MRPTAGAARAVPLRVSVPSFLPPRIQLSAHLGVLRPACVSAHHAVAASAHVLGSTTGNHCYLLITDYDSAARG
eukprot:3038499-Prymnesium_polylepis.1